MASYLNPRHVVLLHFLHFLFNGRIMLVLETKRLHMVHVTIAIEEVTLQSGSRFFLRVASSTCFVLVISIAIVPGKWQKTK